MTLKNSTSPALKTFCVWADYVRRVYQHVEATSPREAHEKAKTEANWEPCRVHDDNGYRLSNEVQDLETEDFVPVLGTSHCRTCGSELVESVNGGKFRDGECNACEYGRYQTQPELVSVVRSCRVAFEERISCLKEELAAGYADRDDIRVQIGNYKYLVKRCESVLTKTIAGRAPDTV